MHSVIDSATRSHGDRALQAKQFARRVFFDYPDILKEWFTNPRYTDKHGRPAVLQVRNHKNSFDSLVHQVAPGADPDEALAVLARTETVRRVGVNRVRARSRVFNTSNSDSLNAVRMFCVIDALLNMVEKNVTVRAHERFNSGFYERVATNRSVDTRSIATFRRFLREQGDDFMQTVDDWLSAHSIEGRHRKGSRKSCCVGTGVYMFASE
jgi:hypothetical protein